MAPNVRKLESLYDSLRGFADPQGRAVTIFTVQATSPVGAGFVSRCNGCGKMRFYTKKKHIDRFTAKHGKHTNK